MKEKDEIFIQKLFECNKHKEKLEVAATKLSLLMPLNPQKYRRLTVEDNSFIDQLVFRFSKLQDSLGEKVFPALLELLGEEIKTKSFIDRLNRLEELNLLNSEAWMRLRKDRNEIVHEYSFNENEVIESINRIFEIDQSLLDTYSNIVIYCKEEFIFVRESELLK